MADSDDITHDESARKCPGCNQDIDPDVCWCGDAIDHSPWAGHSAVPMGCQCGYVDDFTCPTCDGTGEI